jgi:predicted permease
LFERINAELVAQPEVASVGMSDNALLTNSNSSSTVKLPGYTPAEEENMNPLWLRVSPAFFTTLEAPLLQGRGFEERDGADAPKVAVVNESFAKHFFKGENPVGRRFGSRRSEDYEYEIVGMVKDFRQSSVNEREGREQVFFPFAQARVLGSMTYYVKARGTETALADSIRSIAARVDPMVPPTDFATLAKTREDSIAAERTMAYLATVFGAIAMLLAALGLYGVLSHGVSQRFREIGVRVAMGAQPADILRLILGQAGRLLLAGLVLGIPITFGVAALVSSQLFGVPAFDGIAILIALTVLGGSGILAAYLPALRASRVDPAHTLRYE